jgi:replication fork protection complex subunit Csm3/Swi3
MSSPATSRPLPTEGPTAGGDELDDLFNYDVDDVNDPFSENYVVPGSKERAKEAVSKSKADAGLGIDKEIEVARKPRAPRVKLDEDRYGSLVRGLWVLLTRIVDFFQQTASRNYGAKQSIT